MKDRSNDPSHSGIAGIHSLFVFWPLVSVAKLLVIVMKKEERKEMFYLTTHSTHFYLRLYGVGPYIKDHSDSERGNPLLVVDTDIPFRGGRDMN